MNVFELKFEYDSNKMKNREISLSYICLNKLLLDVVQYLSDLVLYQTNHQEHITIDCFDEKLSEKVLFELEHWLERFLLTKKEYVGIKAVRYWNEKIVNEFDGLLPIVIIDQTQ